MNCICFHPRTKHSMFTLCSQRSSSHRSSPGVSWPAVSAAGPAPEGIRLQSPIEVISDSCREGCRVKVSRQSGSVRKRTLSSKCFVCKSLLINLMPLAELHSRLKSFTRTKKKSHDTIILEIVLQHWI